MNFNFLSNTPIFRRLFIAFAFATLIPAVVIGLLGTFYVNSLVTRGQAVTTTFEAQSVAYAEQVNLQRMDALLKVRTAQVFAGSNQDPSLTATGELANNEILFLQTEFDQSLTSYQQKYEIATSANMGQVRDTLLSEDPKTPIIQDQQQTINAVINEWRAYKTSQGSVLLALDQKQPYATVYPLLFKAEQQFTGLKNSWQHVVNLAQTCGNIVSNVGDAQINPVRAATVIAIVSTILLVVAIGYVINQTITRPLRQLATLTRRIAKGETSARASIAGRDEIYLVASSMNNMLDNIVHLIQETQTQRDNLQAQVEKLVSEVSGVGEGDLRVQAEVTADALGVLADSFNYMVEELSSLVVRVKMVASEVENTTVGILDRMTQLVETGDMQVRQIGQAAVEVEHMAESSRHAADRAQALLSVARTARRDAQGGRESVQQAVEGMDRIHENVQATADKVEALGDSSKEINNIVDVISQIAHQTNRLALDAAIQAAMAGENGKGFGAVAADIRRLAERAKEQASSIARIVRVVREDISAAAIAMQDTERETSAGTRLTQEAGIALESLFAAVEQQAREIESINQTANQQLQSTSAVSQIMQAITETTRQSGLSTREASQNMERLSRLVEQLRASTEAFKLRENQDSYVPMNSVSVYSEAEQEGQLSMSGIFRTVTASALPSSTNGGYAALPPASSVGRGAPADPFAFYSMTGNQAQGGQPYQQGQPGYPEQPHYPTYPGQPYQNGSPDPRQAPAQAWNQAAQNEQPWEAQWQGQQWYPEAYEEHPANGNSNAGRNR